ncbi:MAG: hypothetical protein DRP79_07115, partial [Planctomycetota bacterium]
PVSIEIEKRWDGRWATGQPHAGKFVDPGPYFVRIEAYTKKFWKIWRDWVEYRIDVVRLGVTEVTFEDSDSDGDGSVDNNHYEMMYHLKPDSTEVSGPANDFVIPIPQWRIGKDDWDGTEDKAVLDLDDGTPRSEKVPRSTVTDLDPEKPTPIGLMWPQEDKNGVLTVVEDDNFNRPACYKKGSKVRVKVKTGNDYVSQIDGNAHTFDSYDTTYDIAIRAEGFASVEGGNDEEDIGPNTEYELQSDGAIPDNVHQKMDYTIKTYFEYKDKGKWYRVPGYQKTTHALYSVLDEPIEPYLDSGGNSRLWVGAVHLATEWADGAASREDAAKLVTEAIYELGKDGTLLYDGPPTANGNGKTTYYISAGPSFNLTEAFERAVGGAGKGATLNCVDCAGFVQAFTRSLGVNLLNGEITRYSGGSETGFFCNKMLVIGAESVTNPKFYFPFERGKGYGTFAYHEVCWLNSYDYGGKVYDACLKLDGDTNPTKSPYPLDEAVLSTGMIFDQRLDGTITKNHSKGVLRYLAIGPHAGDETWTVTYNAGGTWDVVGSESGAMDNDASTDIFYESKKGSKVSHVSFTIKRTGAAFAVGDKFEFKTKSIGSSVLSDVEKNLDADGNPAFEGTLSGLTHDPAKAVAGRTWFVIYDGAAGNWKVVEIGPTTKNHARATTGTAYTSDNGEVSFTISGVSGVASGECFVFHVVVNDYGDYKSRLASTYQDCVPGGEAVIWPVR